MPENVFCLTSGLLIAAISRARQRVKLIKPQEGIRAAIRAEKLQSSPLSYVLAICTAGTSLLLLVIWTSLIFVMGAIYGGALGAEVVQVYMFRQAAKSVANAAWSSVWSLLLQGFRTTQALPDID